MIDGLRKQASGLALLTDRPLWSPSRRRLCSEEGQALFEEYFLGFCRYFFEFFLCHRFVSFSLLPFSISYYTRMSLFSKDKTVVTHRHSSAFIDSYRLLKRSIDPRVTVLGQKAGSLKTVRPKLSLWIESHYLCHNMI